MSNDPVKDDVPPLRVLHIPAVESEDAQRVVREFQEKFGAGQVTIQPATQTTRERFITAIKQRRHIGVGYVPASGGDMRYIMAAPLDFGPSRKAADKSDRYHMWDVAKQHVVSIKPEQLRVLDTPAELRTFDPETIVTWCTKKSPWFIAREWGSKS